MRTVDDVRSFFLELVYKYSLNFHPDTPFEDFEILSKSEAKALNMKMDIAFNICEREQVDIYAIGLEILRAAIGQKTN